MKLSEYETDLANLSVHSACGLLIDLDAYLDNVVIYDYGRKTNVDITIKDLCKTIHGSQMAVTVGPLSFCGGPPGQYNWYRGSLLTLVLDKVMHHDASEFSLNG